MLLYIYARHLQFDMPCFPCHQNNGPFEVTFPESLQTLTLGHHFNRDLTDVHFPSHLRSLTLGQRFTWSLHHVNLPNSLCNLFCQNLLVSCDWTSKRAAMGLFESISSNPQQQNAKTKQMQTCHWSLGLKFSTHRIHGCLVYLPTFTREINPNEGTYIPVPWILISYMGQETAKNPAATQLFLDPWTFQSSSTSP